MTTDIQTQTMQEMQSMAKKLKKEFETYMEDLELFSKPEFWEAVKQKSGPTYQSVDEYFKKMGF